MDAITLMRKMTQLRLQIPTPDTVNREIELPKDQIARVFKYSTNHLRNKPSIKFVEEYLNGDKNTPETLMSEYDAVVREYSKRVKGTAQWKSVDDKRAQNVAKKWEIKRDGYLHALEDYVNTIPLEDLNLSDDELEYLENQLNTAIKQILLPQIKEAFLRLSPFQALMLQKNYDGYVALSCFPFLAYLGYMSVDAQEKLKEYMNTKTLTALERLVQLYAVNTDALWQCLEIKSNPIKTTQKNIHKLWDKFVEQICSDSYENFLAIAAILLKFNIVEEIEPMELDMLMIYVFCISDSQQHEVLSFAKEMLRNGGIKETCSHEDVEFLLTSSATIYLENLLGVVDYCN